MPAKVISNILIYEIPTLLRETKKAAMHAEETQAAQLIHGSLKRKAGILILSS